MHDPHHDHRRHGQRGAGDQEPHDPRVGPRGVPPGDRPPEHPADDAVAESAPACARSDRSASRIVAAGSDASPVALGRRRRSACRRRLGAARADAGRSRARRSVRRTTPRSRRPSPLVGSSVEPSGSRRSSLTVGSHHSSAILTNPAPPIPVTARGNHSTSQARPDPVALNATWATTAIPIRPVRHAQTPNTSPATNRPGYSTGRKWIERRTARRRRGRPAAAGSRSSSGRCSKPAVDDLLDERGTDHDEHEEHHDQSTVGSIDQVVRRLA